MARYQLLSTKDAPATGEIEQISTAKLQSLAVQKMISFLVQNGRAVKGSVKVTKYDRKFALVWQNAKDKLFHQQSYVPYIAKDGSIRAMASGSTRVSVDAPEEAPEAVASE